MAFGLRVRDSSGAITLELTDRLPRILGSVSTGTAPGSRSVPDFAGRQPFYFFVPNTVTGDVFNHPVISVSGTTLSWTFVVATFRAGGTIHYGVLG